MSHMQLWHVWQFSGNEHLNVKVVWPSGFKVLDLKSRSPWIYLLYSNNFNNRGHFFSFLSVNWFEFDVYTLYFLVYFNVMASIQ